MALWFSTLASDLRMSALPDDTYQEDTMAKSKKASGESRDSNAGLRAVGGTVAGAAAGSLFGPVGAAVGAVVGGVAGLRTKKLPKLTSSKTKRTANTKPTAKMKATVKKAAKRSKSTKRGK
jgi:phage tail tape-measure protein